MVARTARALTFLVLALAPAALADTGAGLAAITEESAQASVTSLADDALEGRGSGAKGGYEAGKWLAGQLKALGLQPGGQGGASYFQPFRDGELEMRNVLATLPGREAGEAIVIGAHYDHLGLGHQDGSLDFFRGEGQIHNGADDNASGTAAVLEIARAFKAAGVQPRRRVVFAFFDGEERGLLGSKHYVNDPPFPRERTTLMINLDMVGRLRSSLTVYGADTGDRLTEWLTRANQPVGLGLDLRKAITGNSDHHPFYLAGVPVLAVFTGLHTDYHRPSDDTEKVNVEGIAKIARLCFGVAAIAADAESSAVYAKVPDGTAEAALEQLQAMLGSDGEGLKRLREQLGIGEGEGLDELGERLRDFLGGNRRERGGPAARPRLGVTLEGRGPGPGVGIRDVTAGSLAERSGLRAGDRLVRFGAEAVTGVDDLRARVRDARGQVELEVARGDEHVTVVVDFGGEAKPRPSEPALPEGKRWF